MRTISDASLETISQSSNIEPIIILKIFWADPVATSYCDRKFNVEGLVGKIISISGIEDILDISGSSTSVTLSAVLDDTDGSIKQIYDNTDIHKTYVKVLQWFNDLPLSEAFIIFEGEISSPIIWSEADRTLKFDIVTKIEDREVGFSVEEGQFDNVPSSLIGKAWPIVFGTVAGLKVLPLNEAPSAILAEGFGIVNQAAWQDELDDLSAQTSLAYQNMILAFQIGNSFLALQAAASNGFEETDESIQYASAAAASFAQAEQYSAQVADLGLTYSQKLADKALQESFERSSLPISSTNLPTGVTLTVAINNFTGSATVVGNTIQLGNLVETEVVNDKIGTNVYSFSTGVADQYRRENKGNKFTWIDGGTRVKIANFPQIFIASIGVVPILNVWATNQYGRSVVPKNYYRSDVVNYNGLNVTRLIFDTPLTSQPGEWQDSDIEIDCSSLTLGTNVVDIMRWVISNFASNLQVDETSFNYVRSKVDNYPANFALQERKNVVEFLQDLAFQSRCAIWVNDRKFFIRFLPEELVPVDTITDSDVDVETLNILTTETERLVTKLTAKWRSKINQTEPNLIIYRNNVPKYGIVEEEYDFYIYNQYEPVQKAAEFWTIRKSNTWKRLQLKLSLNKLKLEAFDPVEFSFAENLVANGPVTGIIERCSYSPDEDTIEVEAWLPVRLGTMEPYVFAFPFDRTDVYPEIDEPRAKTGNPYSEARGDLVPQNFQSPTVTYVRRPRVAGRETQIGDQFDDTPGQLISALDPIEINQTRPTNLVNFNNTLKANVKPFTPPTIDPVGPNSFFARVLRKAGDFEYTCNVFKRGLSNPPSEQNVLVGDYPIDSELPVNYPIIVHRMVYKDSDGNTYFEWVMQPTVWKMLDEDI